MDNTMSPADIMAMTNNSGLGGDNWLAYIFLFAIMFGWNGFGGNGNNALQQGFDNQNSLANQRELLAATNQSFHDTLGIIQNTYNELQRDIAGIAVGQSNILAQQNQCCYEVNSAIAQNRYEAAMGNASIISAIQAEGNATRSMYQQYRYDDLLQRYNALDQRLNTQELRSDINAATANVVRYPNGYVYSAGPSPFCGCGNSLNI